MRDYTDENVFIGLDVHKATYSITAISKGVVIKRNTMSAIPDQFIAYCHKFFPNAKIFSAYEAGFCGFHLHRKLIENGIHNIVVHASSIEIASRDRVKTDKRDSLKIATQLSVGRLKSIHVPTLERESFRAITRLRESLIRDKTRVGVRIKSFLNLHGLLPHNDKTRVTRKWITNLIEEVNESTSDYSFVLSQKGDNWLELDDRIKIVEARLKNQRAKENELEAIYQSAPGIGPVISRILINELDDMTQFKNGESLYSYTGLTPQEYSSGEHTRQGHISRQGKPILRKVLVQAAWRAIEKDIELGEVFEAISLRAGKKRAIVAVARRLIGKIRACLQKKEAYRYKENPTANIV